MKLFLQYTTNKEKKLIKEAMTIKSCDLERRGWEFIDSGAACEVFKKSNIVVKLYFKDSRNTCTHPKFSASFYFSKRNRRYRKYMARIFAYDNNRIVQRYVDFKPYKHSGRKWNDRQISVANHIADKIKLQDYDVPSAWNDMTPHNVGLYNNRPCFFDFSHR